MRIQVQSGKVEGFDGYVARIDLTEDEARQPRNQHTILVLDCSQSMTDSIARMSLDSRRYVNELPEGDFVSVIIFSGHGTAERIIGPTQCTDSGMSMKSAYAQ